MRKFAAIMVAITSVLFVAGCTSNAEPKNNGSPTVVVGDSAEKQECAERAYTLEDEFNELSDEADGITTVAEAKRFISKGHAVVEDGRDLLDDCGKYVSASDRRELEDGLDEVDTALDEADRLVELYS